MERRDGKVCYRVWRAEKTEKYGIFREGKKNGKVGYHVAMKEETEK